MPAKKDSPALIDTSIWIEYFRNKNKILVEQVEKLIKERRAYSLSIVMAELIRGCLNPKEIQIIESTIGNLPSHPIRDEAWRKIGHFSFQLARRGVTAGLVDAAIAYIAIERNCLLWSLDKDFKGIAQHSPLQLFS